MRNQPRQVLRATTISPDSQLLRCVSKDDAVTGEQFELARPCGLVDKALVKTRGTHTPRGRQELHNFAIAGKSSNALSIRPQGQTQAR